MLERIVFVFPVKEADKAVQKKFHALQKRLHNHASIDAGKIDARLVTVSEMTKETTKDLLQEAAGAQTLFVTAIPETAQPLKEQGAYVAGLIKEAAEADLFPGILYLFQDFEEVDPDSYIKAYQRLAKQPWTILVTKRCILRETIVEDVDAFYQIYADPQITEFMEGLFEDPEDERRYTADYIDNVYSLMGFGVWTVVRKEDNAIVGRAGFSLRNGFLEPELGFLIGTDFQQQGYAKEILTEILRYGKEMLLFEKVRALVKDENLVSIHLLKELGFLPEKEVSIEENIYGNDYAGERTTGFSNITYGSYLQMIKEM